MTYTQFSELTSRQVPPATYENIAAIYEETMDISPEDFCLWAGKATETSKDQNIIAFIGQKLRNYRENEKIEREKKSRIASYLAERADDLHDPRMKTVAIELMGEREYILDKLENKRTIKPEDQEMIIKLLKGIK